MHPLAPEFVPSLHTEDSIKKLDPLAREFVPSSHLDMCSTSWAAKEDVPPLEIVPSSYSDMGSTSMAANQDVPPSAKESTAISAASLTTQRRARRQRGRHGRNAGDINSHESIRKTVYISNIDNQISEELLAEVFIRCGDVVDCRVCGDCNSSIGLSIAFLEFLEQDAAEKALRLTGTVLGRYSICVNPSKTAIVPVNPALLPRSEDDMERCSRTIYCSNIDKARVANLIEFLEEYCGKVVDWTILDNNRSPSTQTALVEFVTPQGAVEALNCSGYCFGSSRIRVGPSKAPLRRQFRI